MGLYGAVIERDPLQTAALTNLGTALLQQGRMAEALHWLDASLAVRPEQPAALGNRAGALRALGRLDEALAAVDTATALTPDYADGHNTRGLLLTELGRPDLALEALDRAIALIPGHPAFWNNRGVALSALGRPDDSLASFDQVLALAPGFPGARAHRGAALRALGRLDEALAASDQILAGDPGDADALVNRGCALRDLGRPDDALAMFSQAAARDPNHLEAHWSLALQLLAAGRFEEGWPLFEWRWRRPEFRALAARFAAPPWLGQEPLAGKTLLLHFEQGLGDSLQMMRYAPLAAARGARVLLEIQAPLAPLARTLAGVAQVVSEDEPLPAFDLHCPLMSLPLAFGPRDIPWSGAYLEAPAEAERRWRMRLGPSARRRVGLVWSGNPRHLNDRNRSLPLSALEPLLALDLEFHALHRVFASADRARLPALSVADHADALTDFGQTAGLIAQLDLVVTVDTAVAHLAGAMGKPTLILLPYAADFRWGNAGGVTPWYPDARLLRQTRPGDWSGPVAMAVGALKAFHRIFDNFAKNLIGLHGYFVQICQIYHRYLLNRLEIFPISH